MNKAWSLFKGKAIINFSLTYPDTFEKVLDSHGFHSVLESFIRRAEKSKDKNYLLIEKCISGETLQQKIQELTKSFKLLTIMKSNELRDDFPEYGCIANNHSEFRAFAEDLYTYWRQLERYCILYDSSKEGLGTSNFIEAKSQFDQLIINLYRKITNNISMNKPKVYRQLPAGTHVGMILKDMIWPIPEEYQALSWIPFVKEIVLEAPFITYPKQNTRDGVFKALDYNPLRRGSIHKDEFVAMPIWVGKLLCYVFCHRNFLTHLVSLANLFEMASHTEVQGIKPDLLMCFGADEDGEVFDGFYYDKENEMVTGYISNNDHYDYFGYMKKMILTLHNTFHIKHLNLPIHGAMVSITTKNNSKANVCIMGDSGAGKSESIEAFRVLADDYISDMTIIFDDMGTFIVHEKDQNIYGYGTETGAFVRLDDLDEGYAFEQIDRSIFMNPDRVNSRLITPISTYEEIIKGEELDIFLYANNYDAVEEGENALSFFGEDELEEAKKTFIDGKRMSKGTTTEEGLTTSYFANPFGPLQYKEDMNPLIDAFFNKMSENGVKIGQIKTQLGIQGFERKGPELAAIDLFNTIKELKK